MFSNLVFLNYAFILVFVPNYVYTDGSVQIETTTSSNEVAKWGSIHNKIKIGEILSRTINDNINFIQWGSDVNKTIMENFISQNNQNGIFFCSDNYEQLIQN